ncbi:MAG: murein biosynthesis integral membrane protein MurJ [Firmicutes bacterium]|nr:murein biosynthesis integral membrane protein MurJ [Bacillota bacterium]
MKQTAIILMIITVGSKILGFAREIVLSYFYGASNISDAYLISQTIPLVIFSFISVGISTGYIPMYSKIVKEHDLEAGNEYTNNLINVLMIISTVIVVIGLIFTEPIVKLFAAGFTGETLALAVRFTKISLIGMYFSAMLAVFRPFLQLKDNYVVPEILGFPMNIVVILAIIISSKTDPFVLAFGSVASLLAQFLIIYPFARKKGYRYQFKLDFRDPQMINMAVIALPVILGVSVNQINVLVDRTLASGIAVGGISALNYANRLNGFVQGLFVTSIATVMYPMISKMAADNNLDGLKSSVAEAISLVNLLVIPATIGAMIFAEPIVKLLFGRGAFDQTAISMTASALFFYSFGMLGFGLREILSRAFYSVQDTKTPVINASIAVGINIVLNLIFSRFLGIGGLALATSIAAIVGTLLLFISFRKKIGAFGLREITISTGKILAAALMMGVVAKVGHHLLAKYLSSNLALLVAIALGAGVYFVLILMMRIKEVDSLIAALKRRFGQQQG